MASNPRTWPVFDGRVKPESIDLVPSRIFPSELFWRQLRFADFDASEMSFSSLIMARSKGDERWTGLPVFTTRKIYLSRRHPGAARHGIKTNRTTLETAAQYSHEQGLTERLVRLEEVFAASSMEQ